MYDAQQMECLQEAAYYEARGEVIPTQFGVIEATLRRVDDWRWDDLPCLVVYAPGQYEWSDDKPERLPQEAASWELAGEIAEIVTQYGPSATKCADHWHDISETPWWVSFMEFEIQIGRIRFYCSNPDDWRRPK